MRLSFNRGEGVEIPKLRVAVLRLVLTRNHKTILSDSNYRRILVPEIGDVTGHEANTMAMHQCTYVAVQGQMSL